MKFYNWLRRRVGQGGILGDVARDVMDDKCFPRFAVNLEQCERHITGFRHRACREAVDNLREAWFEYMTSSDRFKRD